MKVEENAPISSLTTMRLGGPAKYVVKIATLSDLDAAADLIKREKLPIFFLGSGANTLGLDEGFPGIILKNELRGIKIKSETDSDLVVRAMGGEIWDDLVEFTTTRGFSGIEALAKIPGTVGAAPVQNIGAYGQEFADVAESIEAYDFKTRTIITIPASRCQFAYRRSIFNSSPTPPRFFITAVTIRLKKSPLTPPFYNSIQRYIDDHKITDFSPENLRQIVAKIRAEKLPDPKTTPSAGSFFKNVYLNDVEAHLAEKKQIPVWKSPGENKVNSGWLIEQSGLKGQLLNGFRVSEKAALILINEHPADSSFKNLAAARDEIINTVEKKFGYRLKQEPVELRPTPATKAEEIVKSAKTKKVAGL